MRAGQMVIAWDAVDEPAPRRPATVRPVALYVVPALRTAPGAADLEARRERLAEALAQCLFEKLRRSATTPVCSSRDGPLGTADPMEVREPR